MKIVIQNRTTKLFLRMPGRWTNDLAKAKCFDGALMAFDFAESNSLADTEVLFLKKSPSFNLFWNHAQPCG